MVPVPPLAQGRSRAIVVVWLCVLLRAHMSTLVYEQVSRDTL